MNFINATVNTKTIMQTTLKNKLLFMVLEYIW